MGGILAIVTRIVRKFALRFRENTNYHERTRIDIAKGACIIINKTKETMFTINTFSISKLNNAEVTGFYINVQQAITTRAMAVARTCPLRAVSEMATSVPTNLFSNLYHELSNWRIFSLLFSLRTLGTLRTFACAPPVTDLSVLRPVDNAALSTGHPWTNKIPCLSCLPW